MLFAHAHKTVVRRHHKQAVVRAARQQAEHGRSEVLLVARQVSEGNDLGTSLADVLP